MGAAAAGGVVAAAAAVVVAGAAPDPLNGAADVNCVDCTLTGLPADGYGCADGIDRSLLSTLTPAEISSLS
jgi:hypothetical protein